MEQLTQQHVYGPAARPPNQASFSGADSASLISRSPPSAVHRRDLLARHPASATTWDLYVRTNDADLSELAEGLGEVVREANTE